MRNRDLRDIIITDKYRTVLHGQVRPEVFEELLRDDVNNDGWSGRITLYNVCAVLNWRQGLGFTGLLAVGPDRDCALSIRAPRMIIAGSSLTGAHPPSNVAIETFWSWTA